MELDVIRSYIERGFEHLTGRLDDQRDVATQRHSENATKLAALEHEARLMATRVSEAHRKLTGQEQQIRNLYSLAREAEEDRKRERDERAAGGGDGEPLTLGRLKWYLVVYGSGAGTMVALFKILGKI